MTRSGMLRAGRAWRLPRARTRFALFTVSATGYRHAGVFFVLRYCLCATADHSAETRVDCVHDKRAWLHRSHSELTHLYRFTRVSYSVVSVSPEDLHTISI